jgi:hypothetical protein
MNPRAPRTLVLGAAAGLPLLVLSASYLLMVLEHGTWSLGNVVVHEDGRHTFWQTLFFTDHFLREIPIVVFTVLAVQWAWPSGPRGRPGGPVATGALLLAIALVVACLVHATANVGWSESLLSLGQYRTRGEQASYGAHWDYHLLHLLFLFLLTRVFVAWWAGEGQTRMAWWLAAFLLATLLFVPTLKPFTDVFYVAHQAREIATHTLIMWPWLIAWRVIETGGPEAPEALTRPVAVIRQRPWSLLLLLIIPMALLILLLRQDIGALAQRDAPALYLYAPHAFEHSLDLIFALSLMAAWPALKRVFGRPEREAQRAAGS